MNFAKKIIKKDWEFLLGLSFLTTIIYSVSFWNEFVSDDIAGIAQNPSLLNFALQLKTFSVVNIFFSIIYKLFGPAPFWFHLLNTAFHLSAIIAIYILIVLLSDNKQIARLTSLLFALHPIGTESITWISGFPYAAYTLFLLVCLLLFILVEKDKLNFNWIWISALFFALSLRSSEKAIVLPVILFAYLFLFTKISWKKIKLTFVSIGVGFLYGLSLIPQFSNRMNSVNPAYAGKSTMLNPLIQIPIAIYSYIKLLIFPVNLTLYHEYLTFAKWEYYLAVIVTVLLLSAIPIFWRHAKLAAFGILLFAISLIPTMLPINIGWIVAERYVRLGSIGIFLSVSVLIIFIANQFTKKNQILTAMLVFFILIYTPLTIKRNLEWKNQDTLWPATVKASPYSAYAWNNMGDYYGRHDDVKNAIRSFERARKLRPRYADATHNLGNIYLQINKATKAAELFKEALEYNPTLYQSYQNLGRVALEEKNYKKAEEYFLKSTKFNPNPFIDYLNLYIVYKHSRQKDKAQETLITARRLAGNNRQKIQLIEQLILKLKQK